MQKFLWALLFIICVLISGESRAQTIALQDTLDIQHTLADLQQLINSNFDSALIVSRKTQQKAAAINYQKGVWEAQIYEGKSLFGLGQPDSAQLVLKTVLKETQEQKCRLEEIKAQLALADILQRDYSFQPAIIHLIQAEKLIKDTDPFELRFEILNKQAVTHRKMKDYTGALKYFNQLEDNYFYQMNTMQRYRLFQNKGNVYAVMEDYKKTEEYFKRAYNEIIKINSPANLSSIKYNLGALFYKQKQYQEAEEYIQKALKSYSNIGDQIRIEMCYRLLGAISSAEKNYTQAGKYFEKSKTIAEKTHNPSAMLASYKSLYFNYWYLGYYNKNISDMDAALTYYQKYSQLNDSLYKVDTAAKILELEKQYETEKKNNQIALLEKENQHQEDQLLVQQTRQHYLLSIILLVSGILGIFVYFFYYYKKVNKLLQTQSKRILSQRNLISGQNTKLQKALNTQNKLFSIIAHDLRSPLVSMSNIAKLIGFYIQDKNFDSLNETVRMMDQKNEQVLDLTDNLLNWAKSQIDNLKPFLEPISVKEIFEECLELYHPIANSKNITISLEETDDLLLWADRNMVHTICRNLINNAIKFTHQGGSIKTSYKQTDHFAQICIKDSGIGIPKEKIESLFEIDQEKVVPGTDGEKSTGLGLSVCKEFVDAMNGKIWVESTPEDGSRFYCQLLLYNPETHQTKYQQSQKSSIPAHLSN
ncbi:MAG TPA: tetratricopeptide repeat-containing sensor histidine kinase [Sunxiuqinia sp.]|nr:tetratricopeptide repeat-containing sensor histidine kinase [Sunxiuqinia sp.]